MDDEADNRISLSDRDAIKSRIVDLMPISEAKIQLQLSDAVTQIADSDFPQKWQGLVPVRMIADYTCFATLTFAFGF